MNKSIKNKRGGILPENVLKLVLAVIVISILVVLSYQLYGIFIHKTDLEKARATLKIVMDEIEKFGESKERYKFIILTSPKEWHLLFISHTYQAENYCNGENCLCICPKYDDIIKCSEEGICEGIENYIRMDIDFKLKIGLPWNTEGGFVGVPIGEDSGYGFLLFKNYYGMEQRDDNYDIEFLAIRSGDKGGWEDALKLSSCQPDLFSSDGGLNLEDGEKCYCRVEKEDGIEPAPDICEKGQYCLHKKEGCKDDPY